MKKNLKRFAALVLMLAAVLTAVLPVFAAEGNPLYAAGMNFVLVGKGAEGRSIVMDLDGGEEVTTVFYPVTSVKLTQPEYLVKVENLPDNKDLKVSVTYDEALGAYGIKVTAKAMMRTGFEVRYLKKTSHYYEMVAFNDVSLLVINGEEHLPDPKEEEDDTLYDIYRTQAGQTNVLEGLEYCAQYQTLPVDISQSNKVPNTLLTTLKKYPDKSLSFVGKDYAWTVRGSDVNAPRAAAPYSVKVTRGAENTGDIEAALGIRNTQIFVIDGMSRFPADRAELSVRLPGKAYRNAAVNVYQYKNGKIYTVEQNVTADKDGRVSFYAGNGTYIVCKNKSPNAILN